MNKNIYIALTLFIVVIFSFASCEKEKTSPKLENQIQSGAGSVSKDGLEGIAGSTGEVPEPEVDLLETVAEIGDTVPNEPEKTEDVAAAISTDEGRSLSGEGKLTAGVELAPVSRAKWMRESPAPSGSITSKCNECSKPMRSREETVCNVANLDAGTPLDFCCLHCALIHARQERESGKAVPDIIWTYSYNEKSGFNAQDALIVIGSGGKTCCLPSTLPFSSIETAENFVEESGGQIKTWDEAMDLPPDMLANSAKINQ